MVASNTLLNPSIIAKEALMLLENNLVAGNLVNRAYEDEYAKRSNGNKVGDTITIRKPVRYTVRTTSTANPQNTVEKSTTIVVNKVAGIDLQFTSSDMTLKITEFSERYLKSAMIQIANQVDVDVLSMYKSVWNWVGTAGNTLSTYAGFAAAPQRLDEMAVPVGERTGCLTPADKYGLLATFTGLYLDGIAKTALTKAKLPEIAGVDAYATQNVQTQTVGSWGTTPQTSGTDQSVTYDGTNQQTLNIKGLTTTTGTVVAGDVFTIASLSAVNPVTKAKLSYLQQFTVITGATADGSGLAAITISPAIITSGAYQTVSGTNANSDNIVKKGTASTAYVQNLVFHKNAFALVVVPMELPQGAVNAARESYNGLSVRLVPYYDGTNDYDNWRLDVLYGVKAIYPDLATRVSGA